MVHLKKIMGVVSTLFAGLANPSQYHVDRFGFQRDRENLQSDTHQVLNTLNRNIQKAYAQHGFQSR